MKLELKHLAGYLPYELLITKSDWDNYMRLTLCSDYLYDSKNKYDIGIVDTLSFQAKPILRPLSDLTKNEWNDIFVNDDIDYILNIYQSDNHLGCVEYYLVNLLLKNHFDIYGLIENNLAINKNTIL